MLGKEVPGQCLKQLTKYLVENALNYPWTLDCEKPTEKN